MQDEVTTLSPENDFSEIIGFSFEGNALDG